MLLIEAVPFITSSLVVNVLFIFMVTLPERV